MFMYSKGLRFSIGLPSTSKPKFNAVMRLPNSNSRATLDYEGSVNNVGWDCRGFFGITLDHMQDKICSRNLRLHYGLVTSKRVWIIVHILLYALIQKIGVHTVII
jgi:hypothetical protein